MTFRALIKYNFIDYFRSTKFILPLVTIILLQISIYATQPIELIDSILISCTYSFLIALWIGYSYNDLEDEVSQQILILKVGKAYKYYVSQTILLVFLCLFISLIDTIVPLLCDIASQHTLFDRSVTSYDLFSFFILLFGTSLSGAFLGSLIHPRLITNKRFALVLALLIAVLSLAKYAIVLENNFLAYVLWVLPPIADYFAVFREYTYFPLTTILFTSLSMLLYAAVYLIIRVVLLNKIKF